MSTKGKFSPEVFQEMPVIGIMRNLPAQVIEHIVPLYQQAGLTTLEVTMDAEEAPHIIQTLAAQYPGLNIGAGTVCEMSDLHLALHAGASFIVTPILNEEVIIYCAQNGIPVFPGALTPTEIYKAWKLGATAVKIFPAQQVGPSYLAELKGPMKNIKLLPTGGVSINNIQDYFRAGCMGAGMGSSLFDKQMIAREDYQQLFAHFKNIYAKVAEVIKPSC